MIQEPFILLSDIKPGDVLDLCYETWLVLLTTKRAMRYVVLETGHAFTTYFHHFHERKISNCRFIARGKGST